MVGDKRCPVEGCPRATASNGRGGRRGYCSSHYHRWQRYGDPLATSPTRPRGEYGRPAVERFLSRVNFDGARGCWLVPTRQQDGYALAGTLDDGKTPHAHAATDIQRNDGKARTVSVPAHRYMWWLIFGVCPPGELDHTCYQRNCVNPAHLEPVDHQENLRRGNEQRRRERAAYRLLEQLHPERMAGL